jgi:pyruvate dehydrogenase (quinone)
VDAVRRTDGIEWVHVRNEEAGAFAAAAEAQLTGRLAVCAGSCGPGNTHLIQGLYDAHRTGAPVLAIASHIASFQVGTSFFQETHPERLFVECSHYCELVSQAAQMPRLARSAVRHALGLGGVSVLAISGDVLHRAAAHPTGTSYAAGSKATAVPSPEQVQALAERLNTAETVTLFCGAGVEGAHAEVMELAGKLHSPIGHSLRGKEWIQYDNPYDVGMSGLLGYGACYDATNDSDLLVLLGTDFPYDGRDGPRERAEHPPAGDRPLTERCESPCSRRAWWTRCTRTPAGRRCACWSASGRGSSRSSRPAAGRCMPTAATSRSISGAATWTPSSTTTLWWCRRAPAGASMTA